MTAAGDVDNIAAGLLEPSRAAEVERHHKALVVAMNHTADERGEQDALAVFEAIARLFGQMTGAMEDEARRGFLCFVMLRALGHAGKAQADGVAARTILEPDDMGQGGRA